MVKRSLVTFLFLFALLLPSIAQTEIAEEQKYDIPYRNSFFTGGGLGLQFGNVIAIDVSPQAGYYPLEHISVGVGLTYQFINNRSYNAKVNVYGGRIFTRLYLPIFENIFAHIEYEYMAYKTNVFSYTGDMEWIELNNFLAGVGYRQPIFGRSSINLMLLWNFNETRYALNSNPVVRVGVDISL
jgi:hypothetical protein